MIVIAGSTNSPLGSSLKRGLRPKVAIAAAADPLPLALVQASPPVT